MLLRTWMVAFRPEMSQHRDDVDNAGGLWTDGADGRTVDGTGAVRPAMVCTWTGHGHGHGHAACLLHHSLTVVMRAAGALIIQYLESNVIHQPWPFHTLSRSSVLPARLLGVRSMRLGVRKDLGVRYECALDLPSGWGASAGALRLRASEVEAAGLLEAPAPQSSIGTLCECGRLSCIDDGGGRLCAAREALQGAEESAARLERCDIESLRCESFGRALGGCDLLGAAAGASVLFRLSPRRGTFSAPDAGTGACSTSTSSFEPADGRRVCGSG